MFELRKSQERGHTELTWLESYHTFSFDQYYDAQHMGFGPLKVINEDTIAPGMGFGSHPHQDMEIITYIISGQLEHKDSLGTGTIIEAGEIQKMSAGQGIIHSSFNSSHNEPVHLIQIWIQPDSKGLQPTYEQEKIKDELNKFTLIGGPSNDSPLHINQSVRLFRLHASAGKINNFKNQPGATAWVQIVQGECLVNGLQTVAGDGIALDKYEIQINALLPTELLLFKFTHKQPTH